MFLFVRFNHSSHAVVYAALVKAFVCFYLVSVLVPDSDQKDTPLSAVDGDLSDQLIEALVIKLLSDWTKTNLSGLLLNESFVQLFAELNHFNLFGRGRKHSLYPELAIVSPVLLGREYFPQNILGMMQIFLLFILFILSALARRIDENRSRIFD